MLDQDNNFDLISLRILITLFCIMYGYDKEKLLLGIKGLRL